MPRFGGKFPRFIFSVAEELEVLGSDRPPLGPRSLRPATSHLSPATFTQPSCPGLGGACGEDFGSVRCERFKMEEAEGILFRAYAFLSQPFLSP